MTVEHDLYGWDPAGGVRVKASLPQTFSYAEARSIGLSKRAVYQLRDSGESESIGRGCIAGPTRSLRTWTCCWSQGGRPWPRCA